MPRYFFVIQDNFLLIVVEWGIYKIFGAPCPGNSTIFLLFNKTFHIARKYAYMPRILAKVGHEQGVFMYMENLMLGCESHKKTSMIAKFKSDDFIKRRRLL